MKLQPATASRKGFALIVTLSLMILLTVIAVGLLTLSSISLRSSSQGNAMATARANARLALMLAMGDLQKNAGPDTRVTARADIVDSSIANPRLTGVWNSWEIKPTTQSSEYEKTERDKKFRGWLVSGAPADTASVSAKLAFASAPPLSVSAPTSSPLAVALWSKGSIGSSASAENTVIANKVPLSSPPGAYAWAIMDEGVKVRINTNYTDLATTDGAKSSQLGAGERPGVEFISGLTELGRSSFDASAGQPTVGDKGITRSNFSLAAKQISPTLPTALATLAHDVTTVSSGLFTDTARGGLKQDFHLLSNSATLPTEYSGKNIYASRSVMPSGGGPSDPSWLALTQFASLYKSSNLSKVGNVPVLKAMAPTSWNASTPGSTISSTPIVNRENPPGVVLMPTIAKVQMLFSLVVRDLYPNIPDNIGKVRLSKSTQKNLRMRGPFDGIYATTNYDYELQLLYTPIVTLHNPYNVALEFTNLNVEFIGVPFAMKVFRSGVAQSPDLVPLEMMTADNTLGNRNESKIFGMSLKTKTNEKPGDPTFRLLPGEVMLFSPYIDPKTNWAEEVLREKVGQPLQFWDNHLKKDGVSLTSAITAMPGWRGFGLGYSLDWLGDTNNAAGLPGRWGGDIALKVEDTLYVEFGPVSIPRNNNKFVVQMSATVAGSTASKKVSAIEIDYESSDGIQKFITANGGTATQRFPKSGTFETWQARDSSTKAIGAMTNVKPFALLTAQAKTTSSGRDATNTDGRFNGKPWTFAHANIGSSSQKMNTEHSANHSHEIDLLLVDNNAATDLVSVDLQGRSSFITGNTSFNGAKFGAIYDIPLAPIQTLAGLNGANPGGSSGYLPRFAQPIGNSWAHPLISTDKISETGPSGYNYLDHSFLSNLALYDGFYFSGLADQTGSFGTGKDTKALATSYTNGTPLDDPRMILHLPVGKKLSEFSSTINDTTGYQKIAAWQTMDGAFNINSTSVPAWKAMLTSIHDGQAVLNQRADTTTSLTSLKATGTGKTRISRMRVPASTSAADGATPVDGFWLGPREYSDAQLQTLAENIVTQVRLRGPFLSMAEFVNRRLGSDDKAQRGALQQAIDDSNLNKDLATNANAGFEIPSSAVAKYKYANTTAGSGSSYQGAPAYLTQADLLNVLGNAATARSDTFTIRCYGEARDASGKRTASATCEAVIQRTPEWIDSADTAGKIVTSLTSSNNKNFGRRFVIKSFRWLSSSEI